MTDPPVVIRPSLLVPYSANQRLPSGPDGDAMRCGRGGNGVFLDHALVEIRPTAAVTVVPFTMTGSVNQRLPSGPVVMP